MTQALTDSAFNEFERNLPAIQVTTLTQYASSLTAPVAFAPQTLNDTLGEWMAKQGKPNFELPRLKSTPRHLLFLGRS